VDIKIDGRIFNDLYKQYALNNQHRIQIYYGGSSSGKSYAIVGQRTVLDILDGKRNYLICRNTGNTIDHSVWNEVINAINTMNLAPYFKANKSSKVITCTLNRKQIIFKGLDDVQKVKSIRPLEGPITDIIIEEATELTSPSIIKDLIKRQRGKTTVKKRLTLIFNPIYKTHFLYKDYFQGFWVDNGPQFQSKPGLSILKSTYRDNRRFLAQEDMDDLENEDDPYYYAVYTNGEWGILGNLIFTNWKTADLSELRRSADNRRHGVDWGFAKDPFAYGGIHYDRMRKKIYILNEVYETELLNEESAALIKPFVGQDRVACDSAEPKSILEYRTKYNINAYAVKKGPNSIIQGIRWLQAQEIIIDSSCQHAINEFTLYKYKENKDGEVLPLPVDKDNHIIDAVRYAMEEDIIENAGPVQVAGI
jgi:phage terminase large subunit